MGRYTALCVLITIIFSSFEPIEGKKVLLLPISTKSHLFSLTVIGKEMVRRGHEVHILVIDSFPLSSDLAKNKSGISVIRYPDRQIKKMDYEAVFSNLTSTIMEETGSDFFGQLQNMKQFMYAETYNLLVGNDALFDEMTSFGYDVAIVDSIFFAKYLHLIPVRLGIPWVTYTDVLNPWLVRAPWLPSFYSIKPAPFFGKMTFFERLQNTAMSLLIFWSPLKLDPPEEILAVYRNYGSFSSLDNLISSSLLFISTTDVVLDDALPFLPNMISAGGLTAKAANPDDLPEEFLNFVMAAKSGVVIVSFGSMASSFPTPIAKKFIEAFSALPDLHFIWRLKNIDQLTIPKNVMIADWLPQNDLLAHPRTKLFITHSGNNGQFESVFHGVPMIGFPLLGDQEYNAKRLKHRGYGTSMNIHDFTADSLLANIRLVVSDPGYKRRVGLASEIFRSAPRSPAERVADGIEHVLRFGNDHLIPAGNDLPLYQYLMLDVLAFVALLLVVIVAFIWKLFGFLFRRLFRGSKKTKFD